MDLKVIFAKQVLKKKKIKENKIEQINKFLIFFCNLFI
jgi:hypothetical protein